MKWFTIFLILPAIAFGRWDDGVMDQTWEAIGYHGAHIMICAEDDDSLSFLVQSIACLDFYERATGEAAYSLLFPKDRSLIIFCCSPLRASEYIGVNEGFNFNEHYENGWQSQTIMFRQNWYGDGKMPELTTLYHELLHGYIHGEGNEEKIRDKEEVMRRTLESYGTAWMVNANYYKQLPFEWIFQ